MDAISLSCPSCASNLQITNDIDRFACSYCGKQLLVNRGGGIVSLKPLVEKLDKIGVSVDRTASELAIRRLKEEISENEATLNNAKSKKADVGKFILYGISGVLIGVVLIFIRVCMQTMLNFWAWCTEAN
jgi:hypothetical protein